MAAATPPSTESSAGQRVLLFPFPYQGHINPMLRLAYALRSRGFSITVAHTAFRAPDSGAHPDFHFVEIHDEIPSSLAMSEDVASFVLAMNALCEAPFRGLLASGQSYSSVVADVVWFMVPAAVADLAVPAVAVMTSSAASFLTFMSYPKLLGSGYLPVKESEMDLPVKELPPLRVRDLQRIETSSAGDFAGLLSRAVAGAKASQALVINTMDFLEGTELERVRAELGHPVLAVGPLYKFSPAAVACSLLEEDRSCLHWLDGRAPASVLFVSFGSVAVLDAEDVGELASGLAGCGHPFIWVLRPGMVRSPTPMDELVAGVAGENAKIVNWAPQQEVLAHPATGGFLTHNGWNSTVEAVAEGVPMICRPSFGDQMGTARYACDVWRSGVELRGRRIDRAEVVRAVNEVMDRSRGAAIRATAREMKRKAEDCIAAGGVSEKSMVELVQLLKNPSI